MARKECKVINGREDPRPAVLKTYGGVSYELYGNVMVMPATALRGETARLMRVLRCVS